MRPYRLSSVCVGTLLAVSAVSGAAPATTDRIGVLITDWAEPEGFDETYRKVVVQRSLGEIASGPNEACTEQFVGTEPFRQQLGLVPYAVGFKTKGLEGAYDSVGFYRLSEDGKNYVSVYDPKSSIAVKDVPNTAGLVTAAKDLPPQVRRSTWAIDPRDGTNHLEGIVRIGAPSRGPGPNPLAFPNGVRDADEMSFVAGIADMKTLYGDQTPRLSPATVEVGKVTEETLHGLFGDRIDVRHGAYAPTPGLMPLEDEVALQFAQEGFKRMVLTRETTDNNTYANNFMTRGYIERALCKGGYAGKIDFQQSRQVGRTPEYNWALAQVAKKNFDNLAEGSEVAVLYTTYGLPFPGRTQTGPFSAPHPWMQEVYHENAYNNYVSFKRYLEAYFGDRYRLQFNVTGRSGDRRVDNYYSYGISTPDEFDGMTPETRFRTLRENIDRAKREGRKEILAVLSHWYHNGRDPLLAIRMLQKIPLNSREELSSGQHWVQWCEKVDSSDAVPCDAKDKSLVHLQYSETFDSQARAFGVGYGHVIRAAIERFGELPATNVKIAARGKIDREGGGEVVVASGKLRGAKLVVARDAHPDAPESFTMQNYRAFEDPADNFVSAWDTFEGYIGTQDVSLRGLASQGRVVSEAVLFGPYRTIVNRPATITLPVKVRSSEAERLRAFVFNEATQNWEVVLPPSGSPGLRYDAKTKSASFDVQVFGVFAIAATAPDWKPRLAAAPALSKE